MSWANTPDRASRTAAARKASHHTRFIEAARTKHPDASDEQISAIAESLRKAHYTELARRSAAARRLKRETAQAEKAQKAARVIAEYEAGPADESSAA
ncbi:hypothetical protein [Streptomyces sp. NPDC058674]|uniref:hypothetical protein n=1 Tax=Streptomyces sp. NPDC058674 TaxID=3346592 RepID=UPI00366049E7